VIEDPGHYRRRVSSVGDDRSALDHRATRWVSPRQSAEKRADLIISAHQDESPV
jgi:hypothetical protein